MSAPNHIDTVRVERDKYPAPQYDDKGKVTNPLGPEAAWTITNAVAYTHRAEGFGLRRKPEGQNFQGYSIDVIIHAPSGEWLDILGASEEAGIPQWSQTVPAGETVTFWAPPLVPEDDVIPPPDDTLESRVAYLEQQVAHIITTMRSV